MNVNSYQGGIVAYILQAGNPGYVEGETHGLMAAVGDQSDGIYWYNGSYIATGAIATALRINYFRNDKNSSLKCKLYANKSTAYGYVL